MTTDALAAKLNYDTYKLNSMTTYKELAATGRILWAVERDDSGNWQDVTERETVQEHEEYVDYCREVGGEELAQAVGDYALEASDPGEQLSPPYYFNMTSREKPKCYDEISSERNSLFAVIGRIVVEAHLPTRKGSILLGRMINHASCKSCPNLNLAKTVITNGSFARLVLYLYANRDIQVRVL